MVSLYLKQWPTLQNILLTQKKKDFTCVLAAILLRLKLNFHYTRIGTN